MDASFDVGAMLLRVSFGAMLAAHGYNKVFGAGGLAGTARWFESLGLRPGKVHARLAAGTEIGAGLFMVLGLLTPVAAAAFVGLMTVAALTDHRGKGFFVFKGGWEYVATTGVAAVAIGCFGPGRWSIDSALDMHFFGVGYGVAAVVAGGGAAVGLLLTQHRLRPPRQEPSVAASVVRAGGGGIEGDTSKVEAP